MATMVVGSVSDVDDVVKTAPWGMEQYVGVRKWRFDGEPGWSLFIRVDPNAGDNVAGLVYAVGPGRKRAAVIGLAQKDRVYEIWERLRDATAGPDLREMARLLEGPYGGMSWGTGPNVT
jgi:hypothetical protein